MAEPRVVLLDSRENRGNGFALALAASHCRIVSTPRSVEELLRDVREHGPEVVVIDALRSEGQVLDAARLLGDEHPLPVVLFVDESDAESARDAMRAGVSAYVVRGANPERLRDVIDVGIARFQEHASLREELAKTRHSLEERKWVDRAKGMLMDQHGLKEAEAYAAMRKQAMNGGQRLIDVARGLIERIEAG